MVHIPMLTVMEIPSISFTEGTAFQKLGNWCSFIRERRMVCGMLLSMLKHLENLAVNIWAILEKHSLKCLGNLGETQP